jgi:2-haloacid dehalogenase
MCPVYSVKYLPGLYHRVAAYLKACPDTKEIVSGLMLDLTRFEWLSFDCYGTLIDWETGILGYLRPLLRAKGCDAGDSQILNLYSEIEPREQSRAYRSYREVLAAVMRALAAEFRIDINAAQADGLAESIAEWKPFPDTVEGLRELKSRYRLAIISNIDDGLFALTAKHLEVPFDLVVTAQQVRSYKPSQRNFKALLEGIGVARDKLLHAAESLYHDVAPARELGIATVWVNRRQGKPAAATRVVGVRPDLEVASVGELARLADAKGASRF